MKILFINTFYDPYLVGGTEVTLKQLTKGLLNFGYNVEVLSFTDGETKDEIIDGVLVHRVKIPNIYLPLPQKNRSPISKRLWHLIDIYNPISKKIAIKYIKDINPDIISIHNIPGWSSSIWDAVLECGIPSIQVLHDTNLLCPAQMFKKDKNSVCQQQCFLCKIIRFPHKQKSNIVRAVVGVSNFILTKYLSYGYFKNVPIKTVIHNSRNMEGINIERKIDKNFITFGFIGTLAPHKGIETLLNAYLKVKKSNFRLLVAGSGNETYEKYLKAKYSDKSIVFLGKVKPEEFFNIIDATVVPSLWYENFPGVILESFGFGVPVIGSVMGGIPELIREGCNGLLFDPYKDGDLEKALLKFASDIEEWRTKSDCIKNTSIELLDYKGWINKWINLYKKVLSYRS